MNDLDQRVLLVDDDPAVLQVSAKVLSARGWVVETSADGAHAVELLRQRSFDVIVSDVAMPVMGGVAFLRAVRQYDLDVPVILITGHPEVDTAVRAVEYGAFRYLLKPVGPRALADTVHLAAQFHCMARLKREALELAGVERRRLGNRAGLEARFAMALERLWVAYEPIVSLREHEVFGYEAHLRSHEPTMQHALDLLDGAERLGRVCDLGRTFRARIAAEATKLPPSCALFVSLHTLELTDDELYEPSSPLGLIAGSVFLDITHRASLEHVRDLVSRVKQLRAMGFRIALGELGTGYAGLTTYSQLEAEITKIDMVFVRDIDSDSRRERIVRSMVELCNGLGTRVIAQGVETTSERDRLADLQCDLLQGPLYGGSAAGFLAPTWGPASPAPSAMPRHRVAAAHP